jgi:hypothetical protein
VKQPRIVFFDLETSPSLGYVWGKYDQNVIDFKKGWYLLSFAMKVLGEKKVRVFSLPDYPNYRHDKSDDKALILDLWKMMNEADVIVAHNLDKFDLKKANARFIVHGLDPPAPFKTFDTLRAFRRIASFNSNKLDDLAAVLKIGRKVPTTGFHLWLGCMNGDMKAWKLMKRYNAHDVVLLEQIYLKIRPWAPTHPNLNFVSGTPRNCPRCGSSALIKHGTFKQFQYTRTLYKQRYRCNACGATCSGESERLPSKIIMH